jgi:hypothetical protein
MKCCDQVKECAKRGPDGKCETRRAGWMECAERVIAVQAAELASLKRKIEPDPEVLIVPPSAVTLNDSSEDAPADEASSDLP